MQNHMEKTCLEWHSVDLRGQLLDVAVLHHLVDHLIHKVDLGEVVTHPLDDVGPVPPALEVDRNLLSCGPIPNLAAFY